MAELKAHYFLQINVSSSWSETSTLAGMLPTVAALKWGFSSAAIYSLNNVPNDPDNYSIPLRSIISAEGHRGVFRPVLKVQAYDYSGQTVDYEFVTKIKSSSEENNVDGWAGIISDLNDGKYSLNLSGVSVNAPPAAQQQQHDNDLQDRLLVVLGDMQWKGLFMIEKELEDEYLERVDPDEIESLCQNLVRDVVLEVDDTGEFYRKRPSVT
jgi:hypothetical protein